MAILEKLFGKKRQQEQPELLYRGIVTEARNPVWYREGAVPDTQDGRFDMIAAVLSLVLVRIEREQQAFASESALLMEVFIDDMDGQLREIGVGDVVIGKHVGKMVGALGGRLSAYRDAFAENGDLRAALERNLYRGELSDEAAITFTADRMTQYFAELGAKHPETIFAGELPRL